jgi:hypothetical protein
MNSNAEDARPEDTEVPAAGEAEAPAKPVRRKRTVKAARGGTGRGRCRKPRPRRSPTRRPRRSRRASAASTKAEAAAAPAEAEVPAALPVAAEPRGCCSPWPPEPVAAEPGDRDALPPGAHEF